MKFQKKILDHFSPSLLSQGYFKSLDFSPLILAVLGGVHSLHVIRVQVRTLTNLIRSHERIKFAVRLDFAIGLILTAFLLHT